MTDTVHILNGDELNGDLFAEALGRTGISDYAERGLIPDETDVDFAAAVVDIPAGKAFIIDAGRDAMLLADARAGVPLATDGVNHVFIYYDLAQPAGERIGYHVDSDGTPPTDPSLEIAEIDMSARTVAPKNDTAPIYRRDAETYKGADIDDDGDGVVNAADEAALVQGANVEGAVGSATNAANADRADTADALGAGTDAPDPVPIESDTNHQGNDVAAVRTVGLDSDGAHSVRLERLGLRPRSSDGSLISRPFQYDVQKRLWATRSGLLVESQEGVRNSLQVRRPNGTGVDIHSLPGSAAGVSSGSDEVRIIPVAGGDRVYDDEIIYYINKRKWAFKADLEVRGSSVLRAADEDTLSVASSETVGGRSDGQLLTLQSATIPSAVFDPDESVWVPIHAPNTIRVLSVALWNDEYNAPSGLRVNIQTPDGGAYEQDGDARETGTYDAPVVVVAGEPRVRMMLTNGTGGKQVAGAAIRYIEEGV